MKQSQISITEKSADYELLDSGEGEKLERFGKYILSRPDPQALWRKQLPTAQWKKVDGAFTRLEAKGDWTMEPGTPDRWTIEFGGLKFLIRPSSFKHTGIFPEQSTNWDWVREKIKSEIVNLKSQISDIKTEDSALKGQDSTLKDGGTAGENDGVSVLNLFGYTGGATLASAQAGGSVVHVDGSKVAMTVARENAELSGLEKKPIRWILDDARAFVRRELKRGNKYAGIIMDPPAFGHGPDSELWKIEEDLLPLIEDCMKLLSDKPLFFLINGYSAGYSAVAYENILLGLVERFGGSIEIGELAIREGERIKEKGEVRTKQVQSRLLPCGIFARWSR